MADPTPYEVEYSFAGFQATSPATPLPGASVDNEFANAATAIQELVDAVKDVRRSDGALKNGIVTVDAMSVGVLASLSGLDEAESDALDDAVALIRTDLEADLTTGLATKAALVHTHAATAVSVSAISGIVGATVQAVLAELRALGPQTGALYLTLDPTAKSGWVACDDGTIGDDTSLASNLASTALAWPLYNVLWTYVTDTYAPVTTGRGLSAAADFAAHKPIALTKMLGRVLGISGSGSGLTARTNGQIVGAETVTLDATMIPAHAHTATGTVTFTNGTIGSNSSSTYSPGGAQSAPATPVVPAATVAITVNNSTGGGGAHANIQPTSFLHAFLKL